MEMLKINKLLDVNGLLVQIVLTECYNAISEERKLNLYPCKNQFDGIRRKKCIYTKSIFICTKKQN